MAVSGAVLNRPIGSAGDAILPIAAQFLPAELMLDHGR
jgi:hypothetical protein